MNKNHHITHQAELEQLIERYFDGETTVQEEQMLREALVDSPWSSEAIDEARFTMGYFAAHRQSQFSVKKHASRFRMTAIAASIAILLTVGASMLWHSRQTNDVCVAYVNGKAIYNEKEVLSLMQDDLNEMGNATPGLAEQLSSLGDAIEIDI